MISLVLTLMMSVAVGVMLLGVLKTLGASPTSPGTVGLLAYLTLGDLGAIEDSLGGFADEGASHQVLAYATNYDTLMIFVVVGAAFATGAALAQLMLSRRKITIDASIDGRARRALPTSFSVGIAAIPLLMLLLGKGSAIIVASTYLQTNGSNAAFKIGGLLAPIGYLTAAYISQGAEGSAARVTGRCLAICYALTMFASATRALGIFPILWLLVAERIGPSISRARLAQRRVAVVALTYLGLASALALRGSDQHGLIPYAIRLFRHPDILLLSPSDLAGNILFGFPLASYVVYVVPQLSSQAILTSLTPLPGSLTDWATISETLRAHPYIPYNAIGELFNYSGILGIIYFGLAGYLCHFAAGKLAARAASAPVRAGVALAILAVTVFFIVTSLEYNTRTITRTLWLLVILIALDPVLGAVQRLNAAKKQGAFAQPR